MKIDTNDIVSVTDVSNRGISFFVNEAACGRTFAVMKNNRVAAVIAGRDVMDRLEEINEREENLRLWTVALTRTATDDGDRHSLEEVAAEFGLDLDELAGDED